MLESLKPFNFILACDGYKTTHHNQQPINITKSWVVVVPRRPSKYSDKIVAMGQTMFAHLLSSVRITDSMIDEAEVEINEQGYPFDRNGWEIIAHELNGKLPLAVYGIEEGRVIDPQTPIVGIINTDDRFAWLPAYTETVALSIIWKMSTVASICKTIKTSINAAIEKTGANINELDYKLINFGDRGADSPNEAPVLAGIAHAVLFSGSDCLRANGYIKKLYNTNTAYTSSIQASQHSVMTEHSDAKTKDDYNAAVMAVEMLESTVELHSRGIGLPMFSVVIDTYDSRRFVREYIGTRLKARIETSSGTLVLRPDSGDITIEPSLVANDVADTFGVTINELGYKVLPSCIGVIQGDGLRIDTFQSVIDGWINAGYSMDRFVLGMGSGISHDGGRDDFSFSCKQIAALDTSGHWKPLLKDPITDPGKKSLSGLVRCVDVDGKLEVYDALEQANLYSFTNPTRGWQLWYKDGHRVFRQSFDDVRIFAND